MLAIEKKSLKKKSVCCLNCLQSFQKFKPVLLELSSQLERYSEDSFIDTPIDKFESLFSILDNLAHLNMGDHLINLFSEDCEIMAALPAIRRFYGHFLFYQEIDLAQKIVSSSTPWDLLHFYTLFPRYQRLVYTQGRGAGLKKYDRVAFIGGGAVPLTPILLWDLFHAPSLSLEVKPEIASLSKRVIEKLGLSKAIKIINSDESCLSGQDFEAVMVAAFAQPKNRIFRYLRSILDQNQVSVSYRTYTGMRFLLYDPVKEADLQGFEEITRILPKGRVNNTICFVKKSE